MGLFARSANQKDLNMDQSDSCLDQFQGCLDPSQIIKQWLDQISSADHTLLYKLQSEFENNNAIIDFLQYEQEEIVKKIIIHEEVEDEDFPENCVSGTILFENGSIFKGIFQEDLRFRYGQLFENVKADVGLEGTWINGLL